MKFSSIASKLFTAITLGVIAQSSHAYLQYTYTSDPLNWKSTAVSGSPYEEINLQTDGKISFSFSFNVDESAIASTGYTSIFINNASVVADSVLDDSSKAFEYAKILTLGRVYINPDRSVRYWRFLHDLEEINIMGDSRLDKMINHDLRAVSMGGVGTCNCDTLHEKTNVLTQRPFQNYIIAATIDSLFSNSNDFSNWTIKEISVDEPNVLILSSLGLLGVLLIRRRKGSTV
ncbi:MAG TPA: hypothetical protein VL995_02640 [Cellvibrio sp.]|nr:hypothetical protein [Cellvibrio sp.]